MHWEQSCISPLTAHMRAILLLMMKSRKLVRKPLLLWKAAVLRNVLCWAVTAIRWESMLRPFLDWMRFTCSCFLRIRWKRSKNCCSRRVSMASWPLSAMASTMRRYLQELISVLRWEALEVMPQLKRRMSSWWRMILLHWALQSASQEKPCRFYGRTLYSLWESRL